MFVLLVDETTRMTPNSPSDSSLPFFPTPFTRVIRFRPSCLPPLLLFCCRSELNYDKKKNSKQTLSPCLYSREICQLGFYSLHFLRIYWMFSRGWDLFPSSFFGITIYTISYKVFETFFCQRAFFFLGKKEKEEFPLLGMERFLVLWSRWPFDWLSLARIFKDFQ